MSKNQIYFTGVMVLGLVYGWVKAAFSSPVFLGIAITYLIVIRVIAERYGKH